MQFYKHVSAVHKTCPAEGMGVAELLFGHIFTRRGSGYTCHIAVNCGRGVLSLRAGTELYIGLTSMTLNVTFSQEGYQNTTIYRVILKWR